MISGLASELEQTSRLNCIYFLAPGNQGKQLRLRHPRIQSLPSLCSEEPLSFYLGRICDDGTLGIACGWTDPAGCRRGRAQVWAAAWPSRVRGTEGLARSGQLSPSDCSRAPVLAWSWVEGGGHLFGDWVDGQRVPARWRPRTREGADVRPPRARSRPETQKRVCASLTVMRERPRPPKPGKDKKQKVKRIRSPPVFQEEAIASQPQVQGLPAVLMLMLC